MTLSEIRRRIDALKRKFARELAIIKLRRIAEAVADDWTPSDPPNPQHVIRRFVKAGSGCPPSPTSPPLPRRRSTKMRSPLP